MKYYTFCLWKAWFDKGYSLSSYPKWIFAIAALKLSNIKLVIILGLIYTFACFLIGWLWYKYDVILAEAEVGNQYNLFQKEMRAKLKSKRFK